MAEKRRRLEETIRVLRSRLFELEQQPVNAIDRPIHEVAVMAVRASLTHAGRQMSRIVI